MPFQTASVTINHAALPQQSKTVGARFERRTVQMIKASESKSMVLLRPAGSIFEPEFAVGSEPYFNHVLCGMEFQTGDGTYAGGSGQLVFTGRRLLGMIDTGKLSPAKTLSLASGAVFCFSIARDGLSVSMKKRRLKPSDFTVESGPGEATRFRLSIFSAMASITNDKIAYWHDPSTIRALSPEGAAKLLRDS